MSDASTELIEIANRLRELAEKGREPDVLEPVEALKSAARKIGQAFSGSWAGYHSRVYYADLMPPPPGAHFSQEWGLMDTSLTSLGSKGDWEEFDPDVVKQRIRNIAGSSDISKGLKFMKVAEEQIDHFKSDIDSILTTALEERPDPFLEKLKRDAEPIKVLSKDDVVSRMTPRGQLMTRDTIVIGQGTKLPPHISVLAESVAIESAADAASALADIARKAGSHLARQTKRKQKLDTIGTNVFIGHGGSPAWRELKDFLKDRLGLPVDEFNRIPVAGITNVARLSEMLDATAIAFLVMTGEDEMADKKLQARMNVIHEAGLFQGRLGFARAIILLEEGCQEFSNIAGLGQIRFPKGNIKAAFEDVRMVLEREGIVDSK